MRNLECSECGCGDLELADSNGARDGTSTRVEVFECQDCSHRFSQVLRP